MEFFSLLVLLETATTVTTTKLVEYGILGLAVLALSATVKILYKGRQDDQEKFQRREQELEDKLLQFSNKSIEVNGKVANALQNNNAVLLELKTLLTEHVIEYKQDRNHQ